MIKPTHMVGSNMLESMKHCVAMGGACVVAAGTWGFIWGAGTPIPPPAGMPCIWREFLA